MFQIYEEIMLILYCVTKLRKKRKKIYQPVPQCARGWRLLVRPIEMRSQN